MLRARRAAAPGCVAAPTSLHITPRGPSLRPRLQAAQRGATRRASEEDGPQPSAAAGKPAVADKRPVAVIENLQTDYCDDFECTSSPAVETTVRALSRDMVRMQHTVSLFQPDVQYQDGLRSFKGVERYKRASWARKALHKPHVAMKRIQMLDKGTAQLDWHLTASLGPLPVSIDFISVFQLNLLTGRVIVHKETWDLKGCSPPAALAVVASRIAWSLKQGSDDLGEGLNKVSESLSSLTSMEEEDFQANPNDPTRFFQQQAGPNSDLLWGAFVMACLYLAFKAYSLVLT